MQRGTVNLHFHIHRYPHICTRLLRTQTAYEKSRLQQAWLQSFPGFCGNLEPRSGLICAFKRSWKTKARLKKLFNVWLPGPSSAGWKGSSSRAPHQAEQTWLPWLGCLAGTWRMSLFCQGTPRKHRYRSWCNLSTTTHLQPSWRRSFQLHTSPFSRLLLLCNRRGAGKCPITSKEHLFFMPGGLMINSFN